MARRCLSNFATLQIQKRGPLHESFAAILRLSKCCCRRNTSKGVIRFHGEKSSRLFRDFDFVDQVVGLGGQEIRGPVL
jgi:hypothetical protein